MNIGLLGFGVVGRGVYDMLAGRDDIRAAWVLCRRDLGELTARTTYEMQDILDDPAVDTVVEVMGGLHPAYEYVAAALRAGKNVVSSNKYLMCRYYDELTALAKEHGAALRCTAAVGGGIPWLTNLEKAAHANHISRVWGILNGTTYYIMDAMHGSDVDFADVLAQAQALGYAEADPSADIDGLDIQRKLILSANVAFGVSLREADVPVFGIRNVRKADIARFQAHSCTCKLIATAEQRGGPLHVRLIIESKDQSGDILHHCAEYECDRHRKEDGHDDRQSLFRIQHIGKGKPRIVCGQLDHRQSERTSQQLENDRHGSRSRQPQGIEGVQKNHVDCHDRQADTHDILEIELFGPENPVPGDIHHTVAHDGAAQDTHRSYTHDPLERSGPGADGRPQEIHGIVADTHHQIENRQQKEEEDNA